MDTKAKEDIDSMNYERMFALRRFAPSEHPYFQRGEVSDYFEKSMKEKGNLISQGEKVAISKRVGWGN